MRNVLVAVAAVVAAIAVLLGLRWLGLLSNEAVVVGVTTSVAVAAVLSLSARKAR